MPGPAAAREEAIWRELWPCFDEAKKEVLFRELGELYAMAWRGPVADENSEWARDHRERSTKNMNAMLWSLAGKLAYTGYLESSGGTFDEKPAPPWEMVTEAWSAFGERVRNTPPEEGELETVEAAIAAFASRSGQPVPPCSDHWLAALRAVRTALVKPKGDAAPGLPNPPST